MTNMAIFHQFRRFASNFSLARIVLNPAQLQPSGLNPSHLDPESFKPHINSSIIPPSINRRQIEIRDWPITSKIIENPRISILNEITDILNRTHIGKQMPTAPTTNDSGYQAARLIVIRKRKMRKHKLKKLRKKMKFEWAKVRQRREMRKEKAFQAVLINQIKEAEKFSAENYVMEKIQQATHTPLPKTWKGRRLPEFIIKEKLGIK